MFGNCKLGNSAAKSAGRSFYSDKIRMKCWKRAIKENPQMKAQNEKPLTYDYLRFAY